MSRALKDIVSAYNNMDIENLPTTKMDVKTNGLLSKRPSTMASGLDYKSPAVRIGEQMRVIRKYRNEVKNA